MLSDFSQFDGGPRPSTGQGNVGIDHGKVVGFGQANHVFIVQVMDELQRELRDFR